MDNADLIRSIRRMSAAQLLAYLHDVRDAGYKEGFQAGSQLRGELDKIKDVVSELGAGKEKGACL